MANMRWAVLTHLTVNCSYIMKSKNHNGCHSLDGTILAVGANKVIPFYYSGRNAMYIMF